MDQKYVGRLITTDQAEAYAKARAREALEKAAYRYRIADAMLKAREET